MVLSRESGCLTKRVRVKVAIRTDASSDIGSGHLMRCLALAAELKNSGANVKFICSGQERKWIEYVRDRNFDCEVFFPSIKYGTTSDQSNFNASSSNMRDLQFDWQQDSTATKT